MSDPLNTPVADLTPPDEDFVEECLAAAQDDIAPVDTLAGLVDEIEGCLKMIKLNMRGVGQPDLTRKHASQLRQSAQEAAGKALLLAAGLQRVRGGR